MTISLTIKELIEFAEIIQDFVQDSLDDGEIPTKEKLEEEIFRYLSCFNKD